MSKTLNTANPESLIYPVQDLKIGGGTNDLSVSADVTS